MNKYICLACSLMLSLMAGAQLQNDPEAREILDRFSTIGQGDYPLEIRFEYIYESLVDKETHTETGTVILQKNHFRLRFGESDVYCDGFTIWNHLTRAGEVYISDADNARGGGDFFISNPGEIFTFYRDGFKYRLRGEVEDQDRQFYEIHLYPEDLDTGYHTIKLFINTGDFHLHSAEALGKQGINHMIIIREYRRKIKTNDETFVFNPADHPEVEIIDTRF